MRRCSSIAAPLLVALSLIVGSGVASQPSTAGDPFRAGSPITVKKPVRIQKLAKQPAKFEGKLLRLEGTVKNVCQGRGCWVDVEDANGVTFMAKSLDESVLLPNVVVGRGVKLRRVIVDKHCVLPDGFSAGFDVAHDRARFRVTERGITLVTPDMLCRL